MTMYEQIDQNSKNDYLKSMENIAKLSKLFTDSIAAPFLNSRFTENAFCEMLKAENLGRSDVAIDAKWADYGIGIKTFLHNNGYTFQKIAEFNKARPLYNNLRAIEKVKKIAELRNERLQLVKDRYNLEHLIYHCITRTGEKMIRFYEENMDFIHINSITNIVEKDNTILFDDGVNYYNFNLTKSTLFKRFDFRSNDKLIDETSVVIFEKPFERLNELASNGGEDIVIDDYLERIILPLYSYSKRTGKIVQERSGLNQWNASGRVRHADEVYIPISRKIHQKFPLFFPPRDTEFTLKLPNGQLLDVKVCQDGSKALMSNPNKDLGRWLLRIILKLDEYELLTYDKLLELDIDSVEITKYSETEFGIDFCEVGSYDEFSIDNDL